jgi:hypothetical protein
MIEHFFAVVGWIFYTWDLHKKEHAALHIILRCAVLGGTEYKYFACNRRIELGSAA